MVWRCTVFFFRLWFGARWVCLNFVIQLIIIDYCRCVFLVTIKMYFLSVFIRLFLKHLTDVFFPGQHLPSISQNVSMKTKFDSTVPPTQQQPTNNIFLADWTNISGWHVQPGCGKTGVWEPQGLPRSSFSSRTVGRLTDPTPLHFTRIHGTNSMFNYMSGQLLIFMANVGIEVTIDILYMDLMGMIIWQNQNPKIVKCLFWRSSVLLKLCHCSKDHSFLMNLNKLCVATSELKPKTQKKQQHTACIQLECLSDIQSHM